MALSGLHDEGGSLSQEEEDANSRTMKTICSFEDVYKTYKPPNPKPAIECYMPPTISIFKNRSNTSIKTLSNLDDTYRPSTSTLISQQVRDKIRQLSQQQPQISQCVPLPKDPQDHLNVNCSRFRIASGQIINKDNGSGNYCYFPGAEYQNFGDDSGMCPANYTGYYDQGPDQTYFKYYMNQTLCCPSQTKSACGQSIDYCCCSNGSSESMGQEKATRFEVDSKDSQSTSSETCCCCNASNSGQSCCCQDRGSLAMPDDINKSDCATHSLCYDQDRMQGCVGARKSDLNDDCSCSRIYSPTMSGCPPPFIMNGCCPATASCCPSHASSPPSGIDCCNCEGNCVDVESFLRKFKGASPACTPNCLTQPSPPCLGMGSGMGTGTGMMNFNNAHGNGNACYCTGYVNDVLQSQTVYSMDYQPIGCRGNNFNHFPNTCSGAGCCIGSGGCRLGGAGMPMTTSCESNTCYAPEQTNCGGYPSRSAGCGLCGDLCGGQSNGIYGIGDVCCGMDFQNFPLSQLSPGYCCAFPTGCCMPCPPNNGCPAPCDLGCITPYPCAPCSCDAPESSCGSPGMYGCCSKATSCNLSQG